VRWVGVDDEKASDSGRVEMGLCVKVESKGVSASAWLWSLGLKATQRKEDKSLVRVNDRIRRCLYRVDYWANGFRVRFGFRLIGYG